MKKKKAEVQAKKEAKKAAKAAEPCKFFSRTGNCAKGDECPYAHDRSKVMVCRSFLQGHCAAGEACLLSHDTSSTDKMPVCSAFLRGSCTDPDCAYRHVKVPPSCLPGVLSLLRLYVFPALLWTPAH